MNNREALHNEEQAFDPLNPKKGESKDLKLICEILSLGISILIFKVL
jgi:hypothetical protein